MSSNTISLTQTLDDRDVITKMQKQLDLQDKQIAKLKEQAAQSKKTTDAGDHGVLGMVRSYGFLERGISLVVDQLNKQYEAQKRLQEMAAKASRETEDWNKKFENQSGLKGANLEKALAAQSKAAVAAGVSITHARRVATQLNSSGMDPMEASTAGVEAMLQIQAATNQVGEDPEGQAKAMMSYLASQGQAKTGANMLDVGQRIFALFQGTNVQSAALDPFAKVSTAFKGRMSSKEQFAVLASAVESFSPEEASTAMRNLTAALTSQKGEKSKTDALKALNIDPNTIDLMGPNENIIQSLGEFRNKYDPKNPMHDSHMATFFGKEAVPFVKHLMGNLDTIQKNIDLQGDTTKFGEAVGVGTSGINRADERLAAQEQMQAAPLYDRADQLLQQRRILERERGTSEYYIGMADNTYESMRKWGASAETALRTSSHSVSYDKVVEALERNTKATIENTNTSKGTGSGGSSPTRTLSGK